MESLKSPSQKFLNYVSTIRVIKLGQNCALDNIFHDTGLQVPSSGITFSIDSLQTAFFFDDIVSTKIEQLHPIKQLSPWFYYRSQWMNYLMYFNMCNTLLSHMIHLLLLSYHLELCRGIGKQIFIQYIYIST